MERYKKKFKKEDTHINKIEVIVFGGKKFLYNKKDI